MRDYAGRAAFYYFMVEIGLAPYLGILAMVAMEPEFTYRGTNVEFILILALLLVLVFGPYLVMSYLDYVWSESRFEAEVDLLQRLDSITMTLGEDYTFHGHSFVEQAWTYDGGWRDVLNWERPLQRFRLH